MTELEVIIGLTGFDVLAALVLTCAWVALRYGWVEVTLRTVPPWKRKPAGASAITGHQEALR